MNAGATPPLVSVIIPTRNRLAFLKEAVVSVKAQTLSSCEAIVVDDASSDGTSEWLAGQGGERLQIILLDEHVERAVARNRGLERARGEFVLFLDDDDRLNPCALERLHSALYQDPQSIGAVGALVLFDKKGNHRRLRHPHRSIKRMVWTDLLAFWMPPLGTALFRTDVLRAVGHWNAAITVSGDRELFVRVSRVGPVILVPHVVLDKRTHGGQWRAVEIREIRERWMRDHVNALLPGERELGLRLTMTYRLLNDARIAYGNLESRKAITLYGRAVRTEPSLLQSPLVRPEIARGVAKSLMGLVVGRRGVLVARGTKRALRRALGRDVEEVKTKKSLQDSGGAK
jgi:glycosyltransferase involved in cell wall biosynthesis